MDIVKIIGIGLTALIVIIILKQYKPEFAVYVSIIAGVIILLMLMDKHISLYLLAGAVEQRSYQGNRRRSRSFRHLGHARKTMNSWTTQKVKNQSLGIIICVMRHGHGLIAMSRTQADKPSITQVAGSHFDAYATGSGDCFSIEMLDMTFHTMLFGPLTDKPLITVTFAATKPEIAMGYRKGDRFLKGSEQLGHAHGIYSSADSKKNRGWPFIDQPPHFLDCFCKSSLHYLFLAIVYVNPKRRDSLNWTLCFVSPSFSLNISTLSS